MNELSKITDYKTNIQKSVVFLSTNSELSEKEIRKRNLIYNTIKIPNICRNKFNQEGERPLHVKLKHY
jgi:hypothetical protein